MGHRKLVQVSVCTVSSACSESLNSHHAGWRHPTRPATLKTRCLLAFCDDIAMARLVLSCKVGWLTGLCTPSQLPVALRHSAQSLPCRQCFSSLQFKTERNNGPRVSSKKKHCDVKVDAAAVATARPETWADVMTAINAEYMDPTDICKALQSDSKRVLKSCGVRRDVTLVRLRRTARCAVARAAATHNYALYHQTQEHLSQRDAVMLGASCILAFGCAHCHVIPVIALPTS